MKVIDRIKTLDTAEFAHFFNGMIEDILHQVMRKAFDCTDEEIANILQKRDENLTSMQRFLECEETEIHLLKNNLIKAKFGKD